MRNYFSKLGTQVPWRTSRSRGATLALPLRYLSALFLLLTLAIGQMWGALTAHVPGVYEKSVATGGYGCTLTTIASGTDAGTFEVYYFSANSKYGNTTDVYGGESKQQYRLMCADDNSEYQLINTSSTSAFTKSCDWIEMDFQTTGFAKSDYTYSSAYNEFFAIAPNGGNASNTKTCYIKPKNGDVLALKVSGYEEFAILAADNGSSKYMTITVDGGTPTSWKSNTLSRRAVSLTTGEHTIVVANVGTSANNFYGFSLKLPSCSTEITTQPSGATLAVGDANPTLSVVATNAASYAWKESSDGTSYNGASTLGTSASFTPSVNDAVQTKYYYCEVTSDCDGTTVVKSNIVTVNVVGAISYYTVTLNPAGGTIVDATGWTSKDGNYEKEVAEGTELTLPIFTKTGRTFKTWRKAGPVDVASPVTVDGDLSLTAIWTATIEQVIYSWVGAEGGAIETGGTAAGNVDNLINQPSAGYYCLKIDGNNSYSANLVTITLAGEEKVKTGDKIKYWGFYVKDQTKSARPKMRDANSPNASIFDDPDNLPNLYSGGDPAERTFTVPASINTNAVQLTRSQTGSNTWISKLQIIREVQVEEGDLLTVTFDANGGSAIAPVVVASGQAVAKPADPTKAHNRFNEWQLSGSTYNFSTPVTASITLEAVWTPLYTVTYAANGGSGTMTDANEYAAGDEVTLLANTFDAPDASYIWDSWAVTDASDNPVSVSAGKFAMPNSAATVKAQWATISDFDVKFFQGYGDPDVQIGITQSVSTGNYATAPAEDPGRTGYRFLGWSYDATVEHIVNVSEYAITATTNFTAMWIQQFAVTFDGAGEVLVDNGATVASPNSPSQAGKIFQGWYNAEVKYDFSAAVTGNLALTSKWADADPNHYVYAYNDDFHFDGVVYKTPEGVVDGGSGTSNITMTTPYTLFAGAEGITSIVITDGIYDSKTGAIQAVTALMKVNNNATSKLTVTIKSGYTATLKIKSSGYSATRTINVSDAIPASGTTTGQAVTSGAMSVSGIGELSFALNSGSHDLTVTGGTLYIAELDIEATALPAHTVTYMPGEGTGAEFIIDDDATEVSDGSTMFTAPAGKIFHGWKDALDNDVAVGAIVEADMTLTAQWIAHYAVTFDMQGHGTQIVAQDIVHGSKAVKPADPVVMGWDFGGWFTDAECTAGNEFDFETPITAATPLFAKWTEFEGCALLYPALSGDALHVGDNVAVQTGSKGGVITIVGMKTDGSSIAYNANGLYLNGGGADVISVTLNSDMAVDTKISVTLMAANTGERGLNLLNATGGKVKGGTMLGWADATLGEVETFSYTVEAEDGLEGTNIFRLQRNNSVYLQCIKVESCGSAVVYHNLTSAVNIAGKGEVALGASSVREGHTTTATFSNIDPLYEFVSWSVSGAGASVESATANPATITMGTEDAVVTLNLQLIPVKFTVNYYDGATAMGTELVPVNEHPTAAGIETAKRHYTFQGWSETDGGSVVALNTITRTEATTVNLYAVYAPVACPTSGTIFSVEIDDTKIPASTVKVAKNGGTLDVADYVIISGGKAMFINDETSDKDAISTSGQFKLVATKAVLKVELDCALQENDIIRIDNNQKWVVSTSKTKTGTYQALTSAQHEFAVTADWVGVDDLYFLYDGSSLSFTQIEVYRRPALTGASLANLTIRQGLTKTPELTLEPSADAIVNSQAWEIVGTPTNLTGTTIDPATGAIFSGTLDNPESNGTISVKVTLNGSIEATCTATVVNAIMQQDVTKSTIWNWQKTGATANIELTNSTDPKRNEAFVLANVAVNNNADFESDKLVVEGQYMVRDYDKTNPYFQGQTIKFNATVAGVVRVKFSNTGGNPARELYINGVGTGVSSANTTFISSGAIEVPVGEVSITAFYVDPAQGTAQQYVRIYSIEFYELIDSRTGYAAKELGTACYEYDAVILGAKAYEVAGVDAHGYMAFDLIESGKIDAAKPYLFEADGGKIFFCKQVGASATAATEEVAVKGMYGTFGGTTLNQGDNNYYYFSGRHIWRVNDFTVAIPIPAHRCYVDYDELKSSKASAPAPGRRRVVLGLNGKDAEQVATDIDNLNASEKPMKVMINGQLFILCGEKMFDATGRLVK